MIHRLLPLGCIAGLLVLASPRWASAETAVLEPDRDATLYESAGGTLANGSGDHLFFGRTDQGSDFRRRALLRFDIASAIPAGATVTSVSLAFAVDRIRDASPRTVALHRCGASWGEGPSNAGGNEGRGGGAAAGDATWIHRTLPSVLWTNPGGDFAPSASATVAVGSTGPYTVTSTAALVGDVQAWIDAPATNAGWVVIGDETTERTAKRIASRENPSVGNRPRLTVTFDAPVGPELACRASRVDLGSGSAVPVLAINGSIGDAEGRVLVGTGAPITIGVAASPSGPNPGPFVLYAHLGEPTAGTVTTLPKQLGLFCHDTPITGGTPLKIWNNVGRPGKLGEPDFPSTPAPSFPVQAPGGTGRTVTATFQGILLDDGSAANAPASITNAVVLQVL